MVDSNNVRDLSPPSVYVWDLPDTERAQELARRAAFCDLRQHSHCEYEWSGQRRIPGASYLEERLRPLGYAVASGSSPEVWSSRKPDTPHGLPAQVRSRFTSMLLSDIGRPMLCCPADTDTEAFVTQVMDASNTWSSLQTARDYKGAVGSAAIVLAVEDGDPTSEPLNTQHLYVRWRSKVDWIPSMVVEQKLVTVEDEDENHAIVAERVWRTRVWDETHVHYYEDVPEDWGIDDGDSASRSKPRSKKPIPHRESIEHHAGRCPVVWMQNTRNTESPEGKTDFQGAYQQSDKADKVRSFATRGTIANTDPTMVNRDHERVRRKNPMASKGHGALLECSVDGDYKLLEASGSGVEMAWKTYAEIRHDILQTVECVIIDPDTAGAYRSGEALAMLIKSMEARAGRLRVPLGKEIAQIAKLWCELGRNLGVSSEEDDDDDQEGIVLPPRVIRDESDPDSKPTLTSYSAGRGRYIEVKWGAYDRPTMTQFQAMAGALTTVTGGKQVLSTRTATELATTTLSLGSADDELRRLRDEKKAAQEEFAAGMLAQDTSSMFPGLDLESEEDEQRERSKLADDAAKAKEGAAKAESQRADDPGEGTPSADDD